MTATATPYGLRSGAPAKVVQKHGYLSVTATVKCIDESRANATFNPTAFTTWLRKYACTTPGGVFSAGAVRVLIDYYRSTGLLRCRIEVLRDADRDKLMAYVARGFYELLIPLSKAGLVVLASPDNSPPSNIMDAIVNASKKAMGCQP